MPWERDRSAQLGDVVWKSDPCDRNGDDDAHALHSRAERRPGSPIRAALEGRASARPQRRGAPAERRSSTTGTFASAAAQPSSAYEGYDVEFKDQRDLVMTLATPDGRGVLCVHSSPGTGSRK